MNIALCTDENFSVPALVCITSFFENNKDGSHHVFILTDGLSTKAQDKFQCLSKIYQQPIDIIQIDKHRFDGLRTNERFPISMYYRFLLPEMLPQEKKVLYLDCDIIVRHSLKKAYETNLDGKAIAAVVAESCDSLYFINNLKLTTPYFNSGVLLINLDYWRENNITEKLISFVDTHSDICTLPDQDALNKVLEGKTIYLDYTYNYQEWWFGSLLRYMHYDRWDDIREKGKDPIIVHFCEAEKPWFIECQNPFQKDFLHYANLHDFIGFRLQKRYGLAYKLSIILDKIGLKFRWWAERWQKQIIRNIKVSK